MITSNQAIQAAFTAALVSILQGLASLNWSAIFAAVTN